MHCCSRQRTLCPAHFYLYLYLACLISVLPVVLCKALQQARQQQAEQIASQPLVFMGCVRVFVSLLLLCLMHWQKRQLKLGPANIDVSYTS